MRLSPQLNYWVYGFHQNQFWRNMRLDGFRPVVFMNNGLMVGMWMATSTVISFWLWLSGEKKLLGLPFPAVFGALLSRHDPMQSDVCHHADAACNRTADGRSLRQDAHPGDATAVGGAWLHGCTRTADSSRRAPFVTQAEKCLRQPIERNRLALGWRKKTS